MKEIYKILNFLHFLLSFEQKSFSNKTIYYAILFTGRTFINLDQINLKDHKNIINIESVKKKKKTFNSNTDNRRDMKCVPINNDYCLLQFDALKFFLGVLLQGDSLPNFNFFNVNPQIFSTKS